MAPLRKVLATLLSLGKPAAGPPEYIWVKKSDSEPYERLHRRGNGLYMSEDERNFIQLNRSWALEEIHKSGKSQVFMEGMIYSFTSDPKFDPNLTRYMPGDELPNQQSLLNKMDRMERALGHVDQVVQTPQPKNLPK